MIILKPKKTEVTSSTVPTAAYGTRGKGGKGRSRTALPGGEKKRSKMVCGKNRKKRNYFFFSTSPARGNKGVANIYFYYSK